jgi:hypothetical protein
VAVGVVGDGVPEKMKATSTRSMPIVPMSSQIRYVLVKERCGYLPP